MNPLLLTLAMLAITPMAHAAELKVLAGGSTTGWLNELAPQFERSTGHKVTIHFDSTPNLIKQATSTPFDLGVVPVDVFRNAEAKARFAAGPTIDNMAKDYAGFRRVMLDRLAAIVPDWRQRNPADLGVAAALVLETAEAVEVLSIRDVPERLRKVLHFLSQAQTLAELPVAA